MEDNMTTQTNTTSETTSILTYKASIHPKDQPVPTEFAKLIIKLEAELGFPIWLIVQNGDAELSEIDMAVYKSFRAAKDQIEDGKPVGLLLHSPGGQASYAYKIARLFQRRSDKFVSIVPHYAKSAATLLALAGKKIIMGRDAELGPLDVQMWDQEKEDYDSALNAVQSLERLNAYALTAMDQAMRLFYARTHKRPELLLPLAVEYATSMLKPMIEKIDSVDLTKRSRELKVAEDYAIRLMRTNYSNTNALRIATALVERYSTHGFVIDRHEASELDVERSIGLGLSIELVKKSVEDAFDALMPHLESATVVIGRIMAEVKP